MFVSYYPNPCCGEERKVVVSWKKMAVCFSQYSSEAHGDFIGCNPRNMTKCEFSGPREMLDTSDRFWYDREKLVCHWLILAFEQRADHWKIIVKSRSAPHSLWSYFSLLYRKKRTRSAYCSTEKVWWLNLLKFDVLGTWYWHLRGKRSWHTRCVMMALKRLKCQWSEK